jgi:hypothetical protein
MRIILHLDTFETFPDCIFIIFVGIQKDTSVKLFKSILFPLNSD